MDTSLALTMSLLTIILEGMESVHDFDRLGMGDDHWLVGVSFLFTAENGKAGEARIWRPKFDCDRMLRPEGRKRLQEEVEKSRL